MKQKYTISTKSDSKKMVSMTISQLISQDIPRCLTCFISLFNCIIPVRSVLVAPTAPTSWIEIAGLTFESVGRTIQHDGLKRKREDNQVQIVFSTTLKRLRYMSSFYVNNQKQPTNYNLAIQSVFHRPVASASPRSLLVESWVTLQAYWIILHFSKFPR